VTQSKPAQNQYSVCFHLAYQHYSIRRESLPVVRSGLGLICNSIGFYFDMSHHSTSLYPHCRLKAATTRTGPRLCLPRSAFYILLILLVFRSTSLVFLSISSTSFSTHYLPHFSSSSLALFLFFLLLPMFFPS